MFFWANVSWTLQPKKPSLKVFEKPLPTFQPDDLSGLKLSCSEGDANVAAALTLVHSSLCRVAILLEEGQPQ